MARSHVKVTMNRFARMTQDMRDRLDDVTETYAGMIVSTAQAQAPVRYGHLRASIEVAGAEAGGLTDTATSLAGMYTGSGLASSAAQGAMTMLEFGGAGSVRGASARRKIVVGQFYGIFHELGTRYLDARPYLEPAVEKWRSEYVRAVSLVVQGGSGFR